MRLYDTPRTSAVVRFSQLHEYADSLGERSSVADTRLREYPQLPRRTGSQWGQGATQELRDGAEIGDDLGGLPPAATPRAGCHVDGAERGAETRAAGGLIAAAAALPSPLRGVKP